MSKEKSTRRNILMWALSLVIAVVLWGYVVFIQNPEGETEVRGIPVEFIGEPSLAGRGYMLTGGRDETVAVRLVGRMQNFSGINRETVTAVVDLSKANVGDRVLMEYELRGPPALDTLTVHRIDPVVFVAIDRVRGKHVDLSLDFAGETAEGYGYDPAIFDPARIYITGPVTVLDTVHVAVARYEPPDPVTRTVSIPVDYILYTESGEIVDSEYITKDIEEAWLTIPVYMVKTVPLTINFIDGGGLTDKNIDYEITPPSVRISGDPDRLAEINSIPITQINLASLMGDLSEIYAIQFPDDVKNLDINVSDAQASIRVFGVDTRDIEATNITLKNLDLPEGYTYSLFSYPITVTLRGPEEELAKIDPVNVRVVADFADEVITGPRHRRTATVTVEGAEAVGPVDKGYEVIIDIVPISDEPL